MKTSPLSIVICAYNALDYTKLLVESIRRNSAYSHEILIYDDGSRDGTDEWIKEQPGIRWQRDAKNRGICTAMNRAARMATREYLFFPNTDHVLAPGWDEALLKHLAPKNVVSCQCIEPGIVPVAPIFHAVNCGIRADEFSWEAFHDAARCLAKPVTTPGVNYPFALSRQLWEDLGGLDTQFDPGPANDPDLFYRLHFAGAKMIRAEDSLLYHFSGKSSRMAGEASREHHDWHVVTVRNEARFEKKWGEPYRYANGGLPDPGPEARKRASRFVRLPPVELRGKQKMLIDARGVTENPQGIGEYTLGLVRALAVREDTEVHCLSGKPELLKRQVGREIRVWTDLDQALKESGATVFHGPAFALPPELPIPSVVTIHDLCYESHPEWYPEKFVSHMRETVAHSTKTASAVIVVSDATKADLEDRLSGTARKTTRVYEALPEGLVASSDVTAAKLQYAGGQDFVLSAGVQQKRKNAKSLVRAFADSGFDGKLVLVGGKDCEDPSLVDEIKARGIEDRVVLTSFLPRKDLASLYAACSVFVYPSLGEGFGLPILEAMSLGAPVITTDAGALREVAGDAALLCEPTPQSLAEALQRVLGDAGLRASLVEKGRKRVAAFSWDHVAEETLAVYRDAERRPRKPRRRYRIAVDARMIGLRQTGTGRYSAEILRHLLDLVRDAEFVFVGPRQLDPAWLPAGTSVFQHIPAGPETLLDPAWDQFTIPSQLVGCDAYFTPTGMLPIARPCKGITVVHDLGFEDRPEYYEQGLRTHLARWIRNACLSADGVIAVSRFTRDAVASRYGIPESRISVVHHGLSELPEGTLPAGVSAPYTLCVSSFEPNKNQSVLVEAFAGLDWPGTLVLAGRRGRTSAAIDALIKERSLADRVKLVLDPSDGELGALYRNATLFAFPSRYEGFGLPLLEAMSVGRPVVASPDASIPEVVGESGIIVESNTPEAWTAALAVLNDADQLQSLGGKAARRAARFSWRKAAEATWEAICACLEAPAARRAEA